ncbi:hypothetical protein [Thiomicrorhabdus sp.]|uniref:hypothetical protein n=1 Tax=Thiomicrorhabdus sp. TaxID=2039724 RepID=UPI0029C67981|nr:hypothetical protein [Thiomicrorhabdus sp.]
MPIVNLKQPGQPVANFGFNSTSITVNSLTIDCAEHQADSKVTVEIRDVNGVASVGDTGAYLAVIEIPAKTYTEVDTGETDPETEQPIFESVAEPLDPNAIAITLWPTTA